MASNPFPSSSIPLLCNICPKKPNFSDTSHLLTHIASKGHLSHYYKTKVRSSNEEASRKLVEEYDAWYAACHIEDLMSERLDQKDRRKSRGRLPVTSGPPSKPPTTRNRLPQDPLDPRLSQRIKMEPQSRGASPFVDPTAIHRIYGPPMQMWPITPYVAAPTFKKEEEPSSETSTIPLRRNHRRRVHSRSTIEEDEEFDELDQPSQQDASKLKGVLWPGMNMFDSATPDMRRKRNQKKATSVVEHLETMSQTVEATELIFSPSGSLRRARTISGQPDSDSEPLKGEDTPPKKRRASKRDTNTATRTRPRRKRDQPLFYGTPKPYYGEEQSDDDLTYAKTLKRKRKLAVHRDNDDVENDETTTMKYLTSEFRNPVPQIDTHRPDNYLTMPNPFRPVDPAYFAHGMSTFQPDYIANPFSYEPSVLPHWDFIGQDLNTAIANPLFMGTYQPGVDEDDERTISAVTSDN
ncbi:hypothetical protein H2203_003891 [Taxawa tesnikishii (nom. ined.)]|nr:hypothetical protein H2203_003891 [Dothideales sp. JES 119]